MEKAKKFTKKSDGGVELLLRSFTVLFMLQSTYEVERNTRLRPAFPPTLLSSPSPALPA